LVKRETSCSYPHFSTEQVLNSEIQKLLLVSPFFSQPAFLSKAMLTSPPSPISTHYSTVSTLLPQYGNLFLVSYIMTPFTVSCASDHPKQGLGFPFTTSCVWTLCLLTGGWNNCCWVISPALASPAMAGDISKFHNNGWLQPPAPDIQFCISKVFPRWTPTGIGFLQPNAS
jgi:hypothetical protein